MSALTVRNPTDDTLAEAPKFVLPKGWKPIVGTGIVRLTPRKNDVWLVGFSAPSSAYAGTYVIRAYFGESSVAGDSIMIRIPERRGIELSAANSPTFVAANEPYESRFVVRNRGNVRDTFDLHLSASISNTRDLDHRSVVLDPGARTVVVAKMIPVLSRQKSAEEVIELTGTSHLRDTITSIASASVLVVPRSRRPDLVASVPAQMSVRAAAPGSGISPLLLSGAGPLSPGSATNVDFSLRAASSGHSVFEERDDYRVKFTAPDASLSLGDGAHVLSTLTSSGMPGFGMEATRRWDDWESSAYVSKNRWNPNGQTEAAFKGERFLDDNRFSASAVVLGRSAGAKVASSGAQYRLSSRATMVVEASASDSAGVSGTASRMQFAGDSKLVTYDMNLLHATPGFTGQFPGATVAQTSVAAHPAGPFTMMANANATENRPRVGDTLSHTSRNTSMSFEGNYLDALSIGYERIALHELNPAAPFSSDRETYRTRVHHQFGSNDVRVTAARIYSANSSNAHEASNSYGLEARHQFSGDQYFSLYVDRSGTTVTSALSPGGTNAGASGAIRLPFGFSAQGYATTTITASGAAPALSQMDVSLLKKLSRGMVLSIREHGAHYSNGLKSPGMNGFYVELRTPLHVPTVPIRVAGRVEGRVVDAQSGKALANMLVRVGEESAITDAQGRVSLTGLHPGQYGVSLESADRAMAGVLVGDATIIVGEGSDRPSKFSVALAKGAHIQVNLRQTAFANETAASEADSLVDIGGLESATIALEGVRDTIYQVTDGKGHIDFGVVAPGVWKVRVISADIPAFHALENDGVEVTAIAGETRAVIVRVVPRRRSIQFIGPDAPPIIRLTPNSPTASPAPAPAPSGTAPLRTTAPNRGRQNNNSSGSRSEQRVEPRAEPRAQRNELRAERSRGTSSFRVAVQHLNTPPRRAPNTVRTVRRVKKAPARRHGRPAIARSRKKRQR